MKAIVNTAPGKLVLQDWPTPEPSEGQVLIQTGACGICATDIRMIGGWPRTDFPSIPGHEWAGTIAAVGPRVDANLVGNRCVAENVLADGGEVGFEHAGGYAEYLLTEARNVQLLRQDMPLATAALIEPLAVAVRGMRRLCMEDTSAALIWGDGVIGLLCLALLRRAGVDRVVVVGGRPTRLALAAEWGAITLNYHKVSGSLVVAIRQAHPAPLPNIIEASGSERALLASLEIVARGGHVLMLGDQADARADFAWDSLRQQEVQVIGSNASAGAWPEAARLAMAGELPLERLISHRFPAMQFAEAVELTRSRRGDVVKVIMEWT